MGYSPVCPTQKNLFVHDISYDNVFLDFLRNFRFVFHFHSFRLYLQNNRPLQKLPPHNFLFTSGQFLNILFAVTLFIILAIYAGAIFGIDCIKKYTWSSSSPISIKFIGYWTLISLHAPSNTSVTLLLSKITFSIFCRAYIVV